MASQIPNSLPYRLGTGDINFSSDTFKLALFQSTMTGFNIDTADLAYSDLGNESSGTGYSAGGATITLTWTKDDTDDQAELTATTTSWSTVTIADFRYGVIYDDTTTPKYVIRTVDFGSTKSITADDLDVTFSNGVLNVGAA